MFLSPPFSKEFMFFYANSTYLFLAIQNKKHLFQGALCFLFCIQINFLSWNDKNIHPQRICVLDARSGIPSWFPPTFQPSRLYVDSGILDFVHFTVVERQIGILTQFPHTLALFLSGHKCFPLPIINLHDLVTSLTWINFIIRYLDSISQVFDLFFHFLF